MGLGSLPVRLHWRAPAGRNGRGLAERLAPSHSGDYLDVLTDAVGEAPWCQPVSR